LFFAARSGQTLFGLSETRFYGGELFCSIIDGASSEQDVSIGYDEKRVLTNFSSTLSDRLARIGLLAKASSRDAEKLSEM